MASPAPVGRKTKYSFTELIDLWVKAGGSILYAPVAAAIAMAESGGRSDAINSKNNNGSVDRGLWQINSVHGRQSTTDPLNNARAAVAISKGGTDWRPWCVAWSNGRCGGTYMGDGSPVMKYLPAGDNNVGVVPVGGNRPATIPVPGPGGFIGNIVSWVFGEAAGTAIGAKQQFTLLLQSFARAFGYMAIVVMGAAMMIVGLVLLILNTRTVRKVAGFAADVGGQAVIYRAVIPDTPVNVNVNGQGQAPTAPEGTGSGAVEPAADPWGSAPIAERPALEPPLTEAGTLPGPFDPPTGPSTLDAEQTTGGTYAVRGTAPLMATQRKMRRPLQEPFADEGYGSPLVGGKKGPPPYQPKHKKKRVVSSVTGREVTDVSMNKAQPPGRHNVEPGTASPFGGE